MLSIRDLISHAAKEGLFVPFRREEREREREGKRKVSPGWPLDGLVRWHRLFRDSLQGSHGRAFRTLVARRIRTCRVSTCRHPSRSQTTSDFRSVAIRPPTPIRSRDVVWPEARSLAEWSFLPHTCVPHPPDTCSVAVEHDEPTENPMVTLTDHVDARIFSSFCRPVVHLEYIAATAIH